MMDRAEAVMDQPGSWKTEIELDALGVPADIVQDNGWNIVTDGEGAARFREGLSAGAGYFRGEELPTDFSEAVLDPLYKVGFEASLEISQAKERGGWSQS